MPRVSVITALYNHERFVAQAIESVQAQTLADWELIVWDDGSTDRSLEIARSYAAKDPARIKVFTHPGGSNRGQENTRNAALDVARGELLCLLDSDDFYHPRKLEWLVPCFGDNRVGLAYGRAEFLRESDARAHPVPITVEPSGRVFEQLVRDNFVCAGATLFRRQCVERGLRFDPEFRTIGEYPLWLKIARDWDFAFVPHAVATWRNHGGNLGSRLALKGKAELVRLCERMLGDGEYVEFRQAMLPALAKRRYDYAAELHAAGRYRDARMLFARVLVDPSAARVLRAKASLMAGATFLGAPSNRAIARLKRKAWEARRSR